MTDDAAPMAPCPCRESGRHSLAAIVPEDSQHSLTLFCQDCGAMRRVGAEGTLVPIDAMSADDIERRVYGRAR